MQLIQSLGEAMAWFERETKQWGVPPTELRHLCGRIGELYAALITNGQMALQVNQDGYDVVSAQGERISVKTTAMMGSGHVTFNPRSLSQVDRVIVLRINTEEMQVETLLDKPVAEARLLMASEGEGKYVLSLSSLVKQSKPRSEIKATNEVCFQGYIVRELESGTIELEQDGTIITPVLPRLKELAQSLNISRINSNGNPFNTRQLGSQIIKSVAELQSTETQPSTPADGAANHGFIAKH